MGSQPAGKGPGEARGRLERPQVRYHPAKFPTRPLGGVFSQPTRVEFPAAQCPQLELFVHVYKPPWVLNL